jgi:hypothetical protein
MYFGSLFLVKLGAQSAIHHHSLLRHYHSGKFKNVAWLVKVNRHQYTY